MVDSLGLVSALECMDSAADAGAVWRAWQDLCRANGFPHSAIGRLAPGQAAERRVMVTEMIENWQIDAAQEYAGRDYAQVDPMINAALESPEPILQHIAAFAELPMPPRLRALYEMPFNQAFPCKFCVPVHGADRAVRVFTALGPHRPDELRDLPDETRLRLRVAAYAGASRLAQLGRPDEPAGPPILSPRERECLSWLAGGCRNARIADRMGITVPTVEMHLASARRKLGAATREQALAQAIILREITP